MVMSKVGLDTLVDATSSPHHMLKSVTSARSHTQAKSKPSQCTVLSGM